jgi:hypothetical protein
MVQQANITMPFACWEAIKGTKVEYNLLDDGTIEHVIMHPKCFYDDDNNPLEWIAARVRVDEDDVHDINIGWSSPKSVFYERYDTDLLEITFEV